MNGLTRTRVRSARRHRLDLPLAAAMMYGALAAGSGAAQSPQPSAASAAPRAPAATTPTAATTPPAATAPPCDCRLNSWRSLERDEPQTLQLAPKPKPRGDPAGSLGWEIAGGVLPAVAGVALVAASLASGPRSSGGHVPTFHADMPLLTLGALLTLFGPPAGVAIAGNATGGTGGAGYAFLGALGGLVLSLPGIVVGSIVGYRLSADDDPAEAQAMLTPILTQRQITLQWCGAL